MNTELSDNYQGLQVVNNGSGTINIYAPPSIPELADKLSPTFNKLANSIDGDNVSSIEFKDDQEELVVFGEEEKSLFKTRVLLDEEKVALNGKIINSNYANLSGQIEIYENDEDVSPGIYRFKAKKNNLGQENLWKKYILRIYFSYAKKELK